MTDGAENLRAWPGTSRGLRLAFRWYASSIAVAPFWLSIAIFVREVLSPGSGETTETWRLLGSSMLAVVFWVVPLAAAALACLPGFALLPWLLHRLPQLDRARIGAFMLILALPIPGIVAITAYGERNALVFAYLVGLASVATPRLLLTSLRRGVFSPVTA